MILATYWQISLSMAFYLTCFIILCLSISSGLYENRRKEKKKYEGKSTLTMEEVGLYWKKYKFDVNKI